MIEGPDTIINNLDVTSFIDVETDIITIDDNSDSVLIDSGLFKTFIFIVKDEGHLFSERLIETVIFIGNLFLSLFFLIAEI